VTAKVTLNSPTGKPLDTRNIRFEWSKPESYSAPPAGQTEPTWGSTPQTSGRAEPTPAPGPIPSPPVSDTAQSFAAPLRADPSPAAAAPAAANCLTSADEVRKLAPKAWPKWTYGPRGERCWYSGRKPVFQKEMPPQAEAIPAPLSDPTIDGPSQAVSNQTQSPPCLASAAEVMNGPKATSAWSPFDSQLRTLVGAAVRRICAKTGREQSQQSALAQAALFDHRLMPSVFAVFVCLRVC